MLADSAAVAAAAPLSEEWGGTYLQVIVTLIIFALGIPALLIQTVAPEVHRIAADRRHDGSRMLLTAMAVYVVLAFVFVRIYHYDKPSWLTLDARATDDGALGLLTTGMVGLTMAIWLRQLRLPARDRLAKRLAKDARRSFRKRGVIPDSLVSDLLDLGTAVPRRRDRRVVLEAIQELVHHVRESKRYHGDGLEQVLMAASRIAADPALPVDADNVELGARILLVASQPHRPMPTASYVYGGDQGGGHDAAGADLAAHGERLDTTPSPDMVASIRAFVRMLSAVTLKAPETTVNTLLQEFSTVEQFPPSLPAKGLFQIGRMALDGGRNHLAVMCLNHLEDVLDRCPKNQRTTVEINLLGLAAHLWGRCKAGRGRLFTRPIIAEFVESLTRKQQKVYVEYYLDQSDFQTASLISSFYQEFWEVRALRRKHSRSSAATLVRHGYKPASPNPAQKPVSMIRSLVLAAAARLFR